MMSASAVKDDKMTQIRVLCLFSLEIEEIKLNKMDGECEKEIYRYIYIY